ncbi:BREX system P-loop protein BrxC [Nevskia ramosa]|uniref:BREX system P-loop protein BrxC n=1 Tax=Nevskia ramosa TaxID=64002 RepID=UPI0003B3007A|nr:BREX system P-loop protein BrxC [Nevskia ramosa]
MNIEALFSRPIRRSINGVIKADQNDAAAVWQELDEYVITRELDQHLRRFFETYLSALQRPEEASGKVGVWISGFFGSGKSHFLKILSYLLSNRAAVSAAGGERKAISFFEDKIKDAMLFGDLKRAVGGGAEVLLFNIDSKADAADGRDTILRVFLKVFNEMQGYCGDHAHIAHMERYLAGRKDYDNFRNAFRLEAGESWEDSRDAYNFHLDALGKALSVTLKKDVPDAEAWMQRFETGFSLTVENFAGWVREYLDQKGKQARLIFLVDEIGQFIGKNSELMLSLQTITENLGTVCGGRAWVVVTSQENIDDVLKDMRGGSANDFSKIQGRFKTRLSLSSANVDEVIQARLLAKPDDVLATLRGIYRDKADILRNQLSFGSTGRNFKGFTDEDNFAAVYPFAPYQFQLVQRIFESIRKAGATGLHLARGERSLLDAFQSAAVAVADQSVGLLIPLYRFYPSIESFLEGVVKSTIDHAADNASLKSFDVLVLKTLFLIRYVDELKGSVDNLITLFIDQLDADRLALRQELEASLQRLENQNLVGRNGDDFFFLTNEERDVSKEIKNVDLSSADEAREVARLIFDEVLGNKRKFRYVANKKDFGLNLSCDQHPHGNRTEGDLNVMVISPLSDDRAQLTPPRCILDSSTNDGSVLIRLRDDDALARELRLYLQTDRYISRKSDGTQPSSTMTILSHRADENRERRKRLVVILDKLLKEADVYVAGQKPSLKSSNAASMFDEALGYLVANTFSKLGYIEHLNADPQKEIRLLLSAPPTTGLGLEQTSETNPRAMKEVAQHLETQEALSRTPVLHDLAEGIYARRPYGWPEWETVLLVVRLVMRGEVTLMKGADSQPLAANAIWEEIVTQSRWRTLRVQKRKAVASADLQKARQLAKDVFQTIGPDGEDKLYEFLRERFEAWKQSLDRWQLLVSSGIYPGAKAITDTLIAARKQLAAANSFAAIELFLANRNELLAAADSYGELKNFFESQKPTWDKLKSALQEFKPNAGKLEQVPEAKAALSRMQEILAAPSPYGLLREVDGLITTVRKTNDELLAAARKQGTDYIAGKIDRVQQELTAAEADADLANRCLRPLQTLKATIEQQASVAHIYLSKDDAERHADEAIDLIHNWLDARKKAAAEAAAKAAAAAAQAVTYKPNTTTPARSVNEPEPAVIKPVPELKRPHILQVAKLASGSALSTEAEVEAFLATLRSALHAALERGERIEIR